MVQALSEEEDDRKENQLDGEGRRKSAARVRPQGGKSGEPHGHDAGQDEHRRAPHVFEFISGHGGCQQHDGEGDEGEPEQETVLVSLRMPKIPVPVGSKPFQSQPAEPGDHDDKDAGMIADLGKQKIQRVPQMADDRGGGSWCSLPGTRFGMERALCWPAAMVRRR